jgi:5-methylcytosine-specific restriction endonuclease McrA
MSNSVISDELWRELLKRDNYRCLNCNGEEDLQPAHVVARSVATTAEETVDDYMLPCFSCHRKSHNGKLIVRKIEGKFFFKEYR